MGTPISPVSSRQKPAEAHQVLCTGRPRPRGVDAPTPVSQILSFERQNNLAINVFGWDKGLIVYQSSKQPPDIPYNQPAVNQ